MSVQQDQSKSPPIPPSSYSSFGGSGAFGASLALVYLPAGFSATFSATGADEANISNSLIL